MAHTVRDVLDQARPVLARLELLGHGSTQRLDTPGRRTTDGPLFPFGERNPPHITYRARITNAPSRAAASAALEDARDELRHATKRILAPIREETLAELKARIVSDGTGCTPLEVSIAMRCTLRLVRVARTEVDRHPETGRPLPPDDARSQLAWARELRDENLSYRQIAYKTGVSRTTLHRHLR